MIPKRMNEEMIHRVDELLLKFETVEDLEELVSYIEAEILAREEFAYEGGEGEDVR